MPTSRPISTSSNSEFEAEFRTEDEKYSDFCGSVHRLGIDETLLKFYSWPNSYMTMNLYNYELWT